MLSTRHVAGYVPGAKLENSRCRRCARAPRGPSARTQHLGRAAAERPCTLPSYPAHAPRLPTRPRTGRRGSGGLAVGLARRMSRPTMHLRRPGGSYAWPGQARGRVDTLRVGRHLHLYGVSPSLQVLRRHSAALGWQQEVIGRCWWCSADGHFRSGCHESAHACEQRWMMHGGS